MKFEPIVELLQDNVSYLKAGTNLFINNLPTGTTGVLLKEGYGGIEIDGYIPDLRRGRFMVAVRDVSYQKAKAICEEITGVLTMKEVSLTGMNVKTCRPLTEPISYRNSTGDMYEFSINFSVVYGIVAE